MTVNTTTRWYRAPELMFGERNYGFEIDIWSLGCTLAELYLHDALFQGTTDISQLEKIFAVVGYPVSHLVYSERLMADCQGQIPLLP